MQRTINAKSDGRGVNLHVVETSLRRDQTKANDFVACHDMDGIGGGRFDGEPIERIRPKHVFDQLAIGFMLR